MASPCKVDGVIPLGLCRSGNFKIYSFGIETYEKICFIFLCIEEIPVVLSKPHFLDGDKSLRNNVQGMTPDKELHDLYVDVEPVKELYL